MARLLAPYDSLPGHALPTPARLAPAIPTDVAEWLTEQLKQVPHSLHRHARNRFFETAKAQKKGWGWYYAKIQLTETIDTMTAKATQAAVEVGIDARDERIKHYASTYASTSTAHANTASIGTYIYTDEETGAGYWLHDAHILELNNSTAKQRALNYAQNKLGHGIQGDSQDSQLARIQNPSYWRREIRKALRPWRELWHLALAPHRLKYASSESIAEYRSMLENGEKWAKTHEMTAPDGRTCPLPTPQETARNRHAQLVAMTKGMENLAGEAGMTAQIITLTLDSPFHARTTANGPAEPNQRYDSSLTPDRGHTFLNRRWAQFRSALKRREIETFWVLGAQPNRDETAHWHVILWSHENNKAEIKTLIYKYFKTNDSDRQIDIQDAKSEMGASSYAMRMLAYITRQTETIEGHTDADALEAQAASAWASTWNIRRYRTSHTGATLWKMARHPEIKAPDDIKKAAQDGDFAAFYKLKVLHQCKITYIERTGKYGDAYRSPRGIEYTCAETGEIHASWKQTSWTLAGIAETQQNRGAYSYSKEPRRGNEPALDPDFIPNSDPPEHWNPEQRAEWAEFMEYKQTQQDAKLAKTA